MAHNAHASMRTCLNHARGFAAQQQSTMSWRKLQDSVLDEFERRASERSVDVLRVDGWNMIDSSGAVPRFAKRSATVPPLRLRARRC